MCLPAGVCLPPHGPHAVFGESFTDLLGTLHSLASAVCVRLATWFFRKLLLAVVDGWDGRCV